MFEVLLGLFISPTLELMTMSRRQIYWGDGLVCGTQDIDDNSWTSG